MITSGTRPIVVGVDGSEPSRKAVAWAVDEAVTRQRPLVLLHAWHHPGPSAGFDVTAFTEPEKLRAGAKAMVDDLAAPYREKYPALEIELRLVDAAPVAALIEASREADLLVLGPRGHSGFHDLMLGSVSHSLVHRTACPVVIVPHA